MVQSGEILQVVTPVIYASALFIYISVFIHEKKYAHSNLQQTYATTTQSLFNAFTSKEYLEMSQESAIVSQYYSLAGGPKQYYLIIQTFDMLEYLFRLYKTKMIDVEQWLRWEATAKYLQFQILEKHGTNKGEPFTRVCKIH